MKKFVIVFSVLLALLMTSESSAQFIKKWEKSAGSYSFLINDLMVRGIGLNKATNHLLVASRTGGNNIFVLNAATGDSVGKLDMTGVAGGTYALNFVKATDDGVIYACNLSGAPGAFKVYRWANEAAVPTIVVDQVVNYRTGDAFHVSGSGANTVLYGSGSIAPWVYVFSTIDGTTFTKDSIAVPTAAARGGIAAETIGKDSPIWIKGGGTNAQRILANGTVASVVNSTVIPTGWNNIAYVKSVNGKEYLAIIARNDVTEGRNSRVYDITTSKTNPSLFLTASLTNTYNANTQALGDVVITEVKRGVFDIYMLVTANGIAKYTTNLMTIAQAREDLDNNLIPDRLNDTVTVKGTVISPNWQTTNNSYNIWDGERGITTFRNGLPPRLNLADSIQITGKISHFNGLTQLQTLDTNYVLFADSAQLPAPVVITLGQFKADPELYEGTLVGFKNITKVSGTWPASGSVTLKLTDGVDTLDGYRIDSDTDIDGKAEPLWPVDIIGVAGQFSSGGAVNNGYQILPRYYATDILPAGTLPVELTSLTASVSGNAVSLTWTTATETNNMGFEVERAEKGSDFARIAFVKGNGTSTNINNYSFNDASIVAGTEYSYRLKQIDFDGTYAYSKVLDVKTEMPGKYNLAQNYPNPFNPSTTISFSLPVDAKVSVKIFNVLGSEVMQLTNSDMTAGNHSLNFSMKNVSSGIYFYTLEAQGIDGTKFVSSKKMTLLK